MLSCVFCLLLCSFSYAGFSKDCQYPGRIAGGEPANITDFPYQLALEVLNDVERLVCGASIIHPSWAVTAAHCVYEFPEDTMRLRSGSSYMLTGGTLHRIEKIVSHPDYTYINPDYDVSLIKVFTPFNFSGVAQGILMATETPSAGTPAIVTGWGFLGLGGGHSVQLQKATVYIQDYETCKQTYDLTPRMLCAGDPQGGKTSCLGDSGGPLVVNKQLVGIVSWGLVCGRKYYPKVYTDVAAVQEWITSYIDKNENTNQ